MSLYSKHEKDVLKRTFIRTFCETLAATMSAIILSASVVLPVIKQPVGEETMILLAGIISGLLTPVLTALTMTLRVASKMGDDVPDVDVPPNSKNGVLPAVNSADSNTGASGAGDVDARIPAPATYVPKHSNKQVDINNMHVNTREGE